MELPADRSRPASLSYRGGLERVEIGEELTEDLRKLSQQEGATLFMALMAAFKVLLMRYSGEEDVSVVTMIANRTRKEVEGLIGFFANTLVMRTNLEGNPSFRELIRREREVALGAYAHQDAPFEKVVEEINPQRNLSRSPLFQVIMALQNLGRETTEIRGLKLMEIGEEPEVAEFDLSLMLSEGTEGVMGHLQYSRDLYDGATVARMARHFEHVVAEVVRDAEQRIGEIDLMSEAEKRQIAPSGKIDRQRLPTPARWSSPASLMDAGREPRQADAGARTPVEEIVIALFEDVLKLDRVGIHDDFFEIGDHSLLATQVVARASNAFGVEIGVRSVFEEATVGGLARRIEEQMRAGGKEEQ